MKLPQNLYSRLSLITSSMLVVGYFVVYAATTYYTDLPTVSSGNGLTATNWNNLVNYANKAVKQDTEILTVTGGKVGIGTTSPGSLLQLNQAVGTNAGGIKLVNGGSVTYLYGDAGGKVHFDNSGNMLLLNENGGAVGIGTTSPSATLEVKKDAATGVPALFNDPNTDGVGRGIVNFNRNGSLVGQIVTTSTATTYTSISDRRLKKDFEPVGDALEKVNQIEVRKFRFKTQSENDLKTTGFIAQQLKPIASYAVTGNENEKDERGNIKYMSVDYGKLTPLLTAAIQELRKENEALKKENQDIRSRLDKLEQR